MSSFHQFLSSPLARHPSLLTRKIAARLGFVSGQGAVPASPVSTATYPAHWAPALQGWLKQVPLPAAPHSFARVFDQDFDETELLRRCRDGPLRGATGLPADIKLVWEYSRGQALFTNAAADPAAADRCAAFVRRWLAANNDWGSPAWTCPMEVSIRAINWICADTLLSGELGRRVGQTEWAGWLWRHGYLAWRGLEARLVSSNHYLADLLGLLIIGSVFPGDQQAVGWAGFASREFPRALLAQTRPDGGLSEASLRYHAYVTEMALLFRLAQGTPLPPAAEARLRDMCRIVADFRDATGDVFPLGDDDSGRVLGLDLAVPASGPPATMAPGRADILMRLAASIFHTEFAPAPAAVCPESGWWVRRTGDFTLALEFGGVGSGGLGGHAHNDDLAFCLDWRGHSILVDPGTYLYTGDPAARNRFRSTFAHNTVIIDHQEQRPLPEDIFRLPGADHSFTHHPSPVTDIFTRRAAPAVSHSREVTLMDREVLIRDLVEGAGRHHLEWRFQLHPAVQPSLTPEGVVLRIPGAGVLMLEGPRGELALELIPSEYSPCYSRCQFTRACAAAAQVQLPFTATWRIRRLDS